MGPRTHAVSDEFDRRNLFLWSTLGAISVVRQLGREVRAAAHAGQARAGARLPAPEGNEALFAALGVVALSRTLVAHWRAAAPARARSRRYRTAYPARPVALRTLLE